MTTTVSIISERLALSRERMRLALQGKPSSRGGDAPGVRPASFSTAWLAGLRSLPVAGVVIDAVTGWWAQHPLRMAVVIGSSAAKAVAEPIAQRNPLGLVLGAALLGGVVVWSRPWRWLLKPALFAGLMPQLVKQALSRLPAQPGLLAAAPAAWPAAPQALSQAASQPSTNRSKNA